MAQSPLRHRERDVKKQTELETYIQTTYFDRILRRANLRLLRMSGGQYELKREEPRDKTANKKEKAGLELSVIDHYNATERSVKTLSGGESFQASLSLALGLADEIQSHAGNPGRRRRDPNGLHVCGRRVRRAG